MSSPRLQLLVAFDLCGSRTVCSICLCEVCIYSMSSCFSKGFSNEYNLSAILMGFVEWNKEKEVNNKCIYVGLVLARITAFRRSHDLFKVVYMGDRRHAFCLAPNSSFLLKNRDTSAKKKKTQNKDEQVLLFGIHLSFAAAAAKLGRCFVPL